jgi:hypothetical protein
VSKRARRRLIVLALVALAAALAVWAFYVSFGRIPAGPALPPAPPARPFSEAAVKLTERAARTQLTDRDRLLHALSACNARIPTEKDPYWTRLNRAMVLFLLGYEHAARTETTRLETENPERAPVAAGLRDAMDKAAKADDPWPAFGWPG